MKRICVFGALGRTGIQVLLEATKRGYKVTAFVYNPNAKLSMPDGVEIIVGDVLDKDAVYQAVKGVDAVISVIGHVKNSDSLVQTKGIQNMVSAMKANHVERIISLTGTGVRLPDDRPSIVDRVLNRAVYLIDPKRIEDGIKHAQVLQESALDWTVLRVLKLTNRSFGTGRYGLSEYGPAELLTSRRKVAGIILDLLDSKDFTNKMPVVVRGGS